MFQDTEDQELYLRLVDCVILGPASITQTQAEAGLGIESWQYSRSVLRKSDTSSQSEERSGWRHPKMTHSSPEPRRSVRLEEPDERSHERSHERPNTRSYEKTHERTHERKQRALRSPDQGHGLRLSPEPKFCIDQGTNDEICHHFSCCCNQVLLVSLKGVADVKDIIDLIGPPAGGLQHLPVAPWMNGRVRIFTLNLNFSRNSQTLAQMGRP